MWIEVVGLCLCQSQASNYDEMTIKAGEELELVADGDGEGWVKVRSFYYYV